MVTLLVGLLFVASLARPATGADPTWVPLGPDGATVQAFLIDPATPSVVYAGTAASGVLASGDGGDTWHDASAGLIYPDVVSLAFDAGTSSTLYALTRSIGLFKSTDGAATWTRITSGPSPLNFINGLAAHPTSPGTVFTADRSLVWKSVDGGATWTSAGLGVAFPVIQDLAVDPLAPATVYAATLLVGLYKSTNGGLAWTATGAGLPANVLQVAADPHTPGTVWARSSSSLWSSDDGGATFVERLSGSLSGFTLDPVTPGTIYAAGDPLRRSIDGGATWSDVPVPGAASVGVLGIDPLAPARLYAGAPYQTIFRSLDAGATWSAAGEGTRAANVFNVVAREPAKVWVHALDSPSSIEVLASADAGASWSPAPFPRPSFSLRDAGSGATVLFGNDGDGYLTRSEDGGVTWTPCSPPLSGIGDVAGDGGGRAYAITFNALRRSDDGGRTWSGSLPTGAIGHTAVAAHPTQPDTVWIAVGNRVLLSLDAGDNWTPITVHQSASIRNLVVDPVAGDVLHALGDGLLYRSVDGGTTWATVNGLGEIPWSLAADPSRPQIVWVGGFSRGVWVSEDAGETWRVLDAGMGARRVSAFAFAAPATVYAATEGGVFRTVVPICAGVADCDDGDGCTVETCEPSSPDSGLDGCVRAPRVCAPPDQCHVGGFCGPGVGDCVYFPKTDGTPCDDGDACTDDVCQAGVCIGAPPTTCRPATSAVLALRQPSTLRPRMSLRLDAAGGSLADFGAPFTVTSYVLCLSSADGPVARATVPSGTGWSPAGGRVPDGFRYDSRDGAPDGIDQALLRVRTGTRIKAAGRGVPLTLPALPLTMPVQLQVRRADTGACWEATFPASRRNEAGRFLARTPR